MEDEKKESNLPYSYHTFLYPFLWDDGGRVTLREFQNALGIGKTPKVNESVHWVEDHLVDGNNRLITTCQGGDEKVMQYREDYRTFQYFNAATRRALFPKDEENENQIVSCYRLANLGECSYFIDLEGRTLQGHTISEAYELKVNAIRLKIFNTGVAVMVFELEYWTDKKAEEARKDVFLINEYGRRVYAEYLTKEPKDLLCANYASLGWGQKDIADFETELKRIAEQEQKYRAELTKALADYAEIKQQSEPLDRTELYRTRLALRPGYENAAIDGLRKMLDGDFSVWDFRDAVAAADNTLGERAEENRVRELLRTQERQTQEKPSRHELSRKNAISDSVEISRQYLLVCSKSPLQYSVAMWYNYKNKLIVV